MFYSEAVRSYEDLTIFISGRLWLSRIVFVCVDQCGTSALGRTGEESGGILAPGFPVS